MAHLVVKWHPIARHAVCVHKGWSIGHFKVHKAQGVTSADMLMVFDRVTQGCTPQLANM